ncbi:MAG: hypothetical protein FJ271_12060 [Planctomycetes bacterium]|nr:hypothetical protein [Planctomycetota bacterium]
MRIHAIFAVLIATIYAETASADLEPYKDYDISDAVWAITTIRVADNMDDIYLEAIKSAWAEGNEVAKALGHIEDYLILRSDLPQSGEFNLMLIVKYKTTSDRAPSKDRHDAVMTMWGQKRTEAWAKFQHENVSGMREITGQYLMREISLR